MEATEKEVERAHTGLPSQITSKQVRQIIDGTCETPGVGVVWEAAGTQSEMNYKGRQQETVAHLVALQPIFGVCAGEKGYKGVGHRREDWWRQEATEKQLWENLAGISLKAKKVRLKGDTIMQQEPEEGSDVEREVGLCGRHI